MTYIRYGIAIIFGRLGLWITICNWMIFWVCYIRKSRHSSWGPLLGGLFLCIGFLMIPDNPYHHLWWIAFFIDWGCIPGIIFTIIAHIIRIYKNKKTQ